MGLWHSGIYRTRDEADAERYVSPIIFIATVDTDGMIQSSSDQTNGRRTAGQRPNCVLIHTTRRSLNRLNSRRQYKNGMCLDSVFALLFQAWVLVVFLKTTMVSIRNSLAEWPRYAFALYHCVRI